MEKIDFNDTKFQDLRCKFDPDNSHIFNDARNLPCGTIGCFDCIKKMYDSSLPCLCKAIHTENVNDLPKNEEINKQISDNAVEITEEIVSKLLEFSENTKDAFDNTDQQIDKLCEETKHDIDLRVDQLKDQLDVLSKELTNQLSSIKTKVYEELEKLNKEGEAKIEESQEFSKRMENMLNNFDTNREQLESDVYKCQDYVESLKALDENFHRVLRKVSFDPSDWQPDASYIGILNFADILETDDEDDEDDINDKI